MIKIGHEMEHEESERDSITGRKRKVNIWNRKKLDKDELEEFMIEK